ncbi:MAG: hypothetical protein J0L70_24400 [Leptolyngbya sp. UWPOB_LEPTO1]|uniref:hypothetical protein n=1 Tax=Leptolyngbya sp. UWPOB_LEPTO1 TaxID=2815653 RepID=UPI001AD0938E|nr:hypothetical protein [Leptolyngbya sp. UWPOB_LEPTO1]MBN8563681.1 hypothetical protein [Leptolyngbya sp. UWPOB_LEPTO1]
MQIEKRLRNHYRRWNINLNYEEEFLKFKNRLIGVIDKSMGDYLTERQDVDKRFFEIFNLDKADKPYVKKAQARYHDSLVEPLILQGVIQRLQSVSYTEKGFGDTYVYKCVDSCETLQDLAKVLQFIFWALEENFDETQARASKIVEEIKRLSALTPSAGFAVHKRGKQFIVYPSGDQFLDRGIIDSTLSELENYPEVAESFERALKLYLRGETSQYRNLLDELRFALEQLLKKVLKNQIPLEKQKKELKTWFRSKGLHPQVVNLYEGLLNPYHQYQNDAVKHNEAFSLDEVEFMIYLTGNLMRLILKLANLDRDGELRHDN